MFTPRRRALWDSEVKGRGIRLQNNLVLACPGPDMHFLEADNPNTPRGPGNGAAVAQTYDLDRNWREGRKPADARGWIPPDLRKYDVFAEKIDGVNRDLKSPDFLRPDASSPIKLA